LGTDHTKKFYFKNSCHLFFLLHLCIFFCCWLSLPAIWKKYFFYETL